MAVPLPPPLLLLLLLLLPALLCAGSLSAATQEDGRPSFVILLCDDLGWGDLECHGHPAIKTPHLNRLAADGIRFTRFYSPSPVCSPSRTGLLTGRTPNRAGIYDWIPARRLNPPAMFQRSVTELRAGEITLPRLLREAGYATCLSGKWHCNSAFNSPAQAQPDDHGFDHWFATQNNAAPSHRNPVNFVRNGQPVGPTEGFSCQIVAGEAIGWLRRQQASNPQQPFFLHVAFHEPHEPVASPAERVRAHEKSGAARNHDEAQYFANVENVDLAVGRILEALQELGRADNTLVIFTSDNGPETLRRYAAGSRSYGRPGPLRGMKLHTHEGGCRVPGIMRWPRRVAAGQVSEVPISSLDFLPTFAALARAPLPDALALDGTSFLPALEGRPIPRGQPLFWLYYNALNEAKAALIDDGWKILAQLEDPERPGHRLPNLEHVNAANADRVKGAGLMQFELYDLRNDEAEARNLAGEQPERMAAMRAKLESRYRDVIRSQHIWPVLPTPSP